MLVELRARNRSAPPSVHYSLYVRLIMAKKAEEERSPIEDVV